MHPTPFHSAGFTVEKLCNEGSEGSGFLPTQRVCQGDCEVAGMPPSRTF